MFSQLVAPGHVVIVNLAIVISAPDSDDRELSLLYGDQTKT
jgi:hypothetical protein